MIVYAWLSAGMLVGPAYIFSWEGKAAEADTIPTFNVACIKINEKRTKVVARIFFLNIPFHLINHELGGGFSCYVV
jgi:hypothetical protein